MKKIESRIQVSAEVDAAAEAVGLKAGMSKPRVLGTFARYGQIAGAESLLGPLGLSLGDVLAPRDTAASRLAATSGPPG